MNTKAKKQMLTLFVLLFALAFLLSLSFIAEHAEHDCAGHDCAVCAQLHTAQNVLRQMAEFAVGALFLSSGLLFACLFLKGSAVSHILFTPVTSKVRMNT